jgi:phage terminase large subunit GpA-like protein
VVALRPDRPEQLRTHLADNLRRVRKAVSSAWIPPRRTRPAKWIPNRVRLDPGIEGRSFISLIDRPWWRDVLADFADPEVWSSTICATPQVGKTLMVLASILWTAENAPAPGMLVLPDKDTAIEIRDRLYAMADESIRRGLLLTVRTPPKRLRHTRFVDLGRMRVYLAWSGSRQRLRGRPCRYVWLSEIDVYASGGRQAGDPIKAAHQRTKAFFRHLHVHESSPSEDPSRVADIEAVASARYRWHAPCPHCGRHQELRFFTHTAGELAGRGGIAGYRQGESKECLPTEEARKAAYYVCEAGCRINNEHRDAMLMRGRWVPSGCRVSKDGEIVGELPKSRRSIGRVLWAIHSPTITFGDIAAAYCEAVETGQIAAFYKDWLAIPYRKQGRVPRWEELGRKCAWHHPRRCVPKECWFLTAGVDVQGENNGVRYVIRGWAPGRTSWLIDWGWIDRDHGDEADLVKSDLRKLTELVLACQFTVIGADGQPAENPLGRKYLGVRLLNCDSNHLPHKVHRWMRAMPESWSTGDRARVRAIRGDHQVSSDIRYRPRELEKTVRTGETYEGGLVQWGLAIYPYYDELLQAISSEPGKMGSFYVTADAFTQGKSYLEQVTNFAPHTVVDEKTGQKKTLWGPRSGRIPVDFWDCEVYALAAAEMVLGDMGWDAKAWEEWRQGAISARDGKPAERGRAITADDDLGAR